MGDLTTTQIVALAAPLVLVEIGLRVVALVSLARAERTNGPKWAWALAIVLVSFLGWALYFLVGRRDEA